MNNKHRKTLAIVFTDPVSGTIEWAAIERLLVAACVFRGTWAVISRDLGHVFHAIVGSHFTDVGRLVDKVH